MFEHSLLGLEPKRRSRRWQAFPIAVGLHLSVAALVVGAQYWQVGDIQAPPESLVYFVTAAPPPPPPPPAGPVGTRVQEKTIPRVIETVVVPQVPIQPQDEVTDLPEPEPAQETGGGELGGDPDGKVGGVPGGRKDGVIGGDPNSAFPSNGALPGPAAAAQETVPRFDGPIHMSAKVKRPQVIPSTQISPRYTEAARRIRLQGSVIVQAVIDERGNVTEVEVLRGLPLGLDQEAAAAVAKWKFTPATLEGRAVKVYYLLTVYFEVK